MLLPVTSLEPLAGEQGDYVGAGLGLGPYFLDPLGQLAAVWGVDEDRGPRLPWKLSALINAPVTGTRGVAWVSGGVQPDLAPKILAHGLNHMGRGEPVDVGARLVGELRHGSPTPSGAATPQSRS